MEGKHHGLVSFIQRQRHGWSETCLYLIRYIWEAQKIYFRKIWHGKFKCPISCINKWINKWYPLIKRNVYLEWLTIRFDFDRMAMSICLKETPLLSTVPCRLGRVSMEPQPSSMIEVPCPMPLDRVQPGRGRAEATERINIVSNGVAERPADYRHEDSWEVWEARGLGTGTLVDLGRQLVAGSQQTKPMVL